MIEIQNYIDGKLTNPISHLYLDNINPATGLSYSKVPNSNQSDVDLAVSAAKKAFSSWSNKSNKDRSYYLEKISELIMRDIKELSLAETIDNGKPINVSSSVDIPRSAENFKYFSEEILEFSGENFSDLGKGLNTVHYSPLGIVGCISPWNLPLYLFTWKIAPALAAGCTVVAKPSEVTPMTAFLLSKICIEAKLPEGVLNIVHGLGGSVGNAITSHPDISAISFTGSTTTGAMIAKKAAETMKRVHLEMGGKNPSIIFSDCDFEAAVETTLRSAFSNQGQICLCGSRIFVEKSIYDKFTTALIEKINNLTLGNPQDPSTDQGAVVSKEHFLKIENWLRIAKEEGGVFLTGGTSKKIPGECENGFFIAPTLIANLHYLCRTNQEEIFGPVATITSFESETELLQMANSTQYGLAANVWSKDLEKANRVALKLEAGIVWINTWMTRDLRTPFGGIKQSGRGKEGGKYILEFFSNMKNICKI